MNRFCSHKLIEKMSRLMHPVSPLALAIAATFLAVLGWYGSKNESRVVDNDSSITEEGLRYQRDFNTKLDSLLSAFEDELQLTGDALRGGGARHDKSRQWLAERLIGIRSISLFESVSEHDYTRRWPEIKAGKTSENFPSPKISIENGRAILTFNGSYLSAVVRYGPFPLDQSRSGWVIVDHGDGVIGEEYLCYWNRGHSKYGAGAPWIAVYLFDRSAILKYLNDYLKDWATIQSLPMRQKDSGFQISDENTKNHLAIWQPDSQRDPDQVLEVVSVVGTWKILLWLPQRTTISYSPFVLIGTIVPATILLLLAMLLWNHQREAKRLQEMRVTFLTRISHDLRTPLTNFHLHLDITEDDLEDGNITGAISRVDQLRSEVKQVSRLLDNALDFSRGVRKPELYCVNPREVIAGILSSFDAAFRLSNIELECSGMDTLSVSVELHTDVLKRVLSNLLENVIKHALDGQWVRVDIENHETRLRIVVSDRGAGLDTQQLHQLLSGKSCGSSDLTDRQGPGLGLLISRELTVEAGGSLTLLESDQGACIEMILPIKILTKS